MLYYGTLKSLTLCVGGSDNYTNGSSLGSLTDFAVLKILCVQSHTLLGAEATSLTPLETLRGILPLNLQHSTIHMCNQSTVHHQGADTTSNYEKNHSGECCSPRVGAVYEGTILRPFKIVVTCIMHGSAAINRQTIMQETRFLEALDDVNGH
jgi:hypothetical protein